MVILWNHLVFEMFKGNSRIATNVQEIVNICHEKRFGFWRSSRDIWRKARVCGFHMVAEPRQSGLSNGRPSSFQHFWRWLVRFFPIPPATLHSNSHQQISRLILYYSKYLKLLYIIWIVIVFLLYLCFHGL